MKNITAAGLLLLTALSCMSTERAVRELERLELQLAVLMIVTADGSK